jgi:hypothetical protein
MPGDGGIQEDNSFDAEFKQLPQSRIKQITEEAARRQKEIEQGIESADGISDVSIADEILVGWDGITDGEKDVPFTKTTKKQLLEIPMLAARLVEIYFEAYTEQKTKN